MRISSDHTTVSQDTSFELDLESSQPLHPDHAPPSPLFAPRPSPPTSLPSSLPFPEKFLPLIAYLSMRRLRYHEQWVARTVVGQAMLDANFPGYSRKINKKSNPFKVYSLEAQELGLVKLGTRDSVRQHDWIELLVRHSLLARILS